MNHREDGRTTAIRGGVAGASAGAALVAVMYLLAPLVGFKAIPQLLQEPILAAMPGPVFGFLIDRLQHLGKVLEELSLILLMIAALGGAGALMALARRRWDTTHLSLAASALIWLLIVLGVLPAGGEGWLGLLDGPTVPIAWALLVMGYAVGTTWLLNRWDRMVSEAPADPERRRLVLMVPGLLGLGSLAALGLKLGPQWISAVVSPPEKATGALSAQVTPVGQFYVVSKNFQDPVVEQASWTLQVHGQVDQPLQLTLEQLRGRPSVSQAVTLECISNTVGGSLMSTGLFVGVPLRDLLAEVSPKAHASTVSFHARDDYTESLPLALVQGEPEILVAHTLDGGPLPDQHGFPARLLVPGRYGMKGPKWLDSIEVVAGSGSGYWEQQGWDGTVLVKTTARFDVPSPAAGGLLKLGDIDLAGVAFAGSRGISAVEYSSDGGSSWTPANLEPALSPFTWVRWGATWTPPRPGQYQLSVRARDGSGARQSASSTASFPAGASGYHTIDVTIVH